MLPVIDVCNKKSAVLIGVTENLNSPLAEKSKIVIQLKIDRESDKFNIMATSSFIATVSIFDALLVRNNFV